MSWQRHLKQSLTLCWRQACHELVPPDALAPVLRQLVDSFVHDRARPEVMTLGLRTVRELCARCPLVMTPELLQVSYLHMCAFMLSLLGPTSMLGRLSGTWTGQQVCGGDAGPAHHARAVRALPPGHDSRAASGKSASQPHHAPYVH